MTSAGSEGVIAAIALGANLGDRASTLDAASTTIAALDDVNLVAVSRWHDTAPVGIETQPRFLNGAMVVQVSCSARELLEALHAIERSFGRDRTSEERWGPRRLDLDLLLFGDAVINEEGLQVPHPRMHERGFVLGPLREIGGALRHPLRDQTVEAMWAALGSMAAAPAVPME